MLLAQKIRRRLAALLCLAAAAAAPAAAGPPPVEAFFRPADIADARLSPSGRWLAVATAGAGARVALFALDLREKEPPRQIVRLADADVYDFAWVSDERLVFRVYDSESGSGDQRFGSGLFSVRRDGDDLRQLIAVRQEFFVGRRTGPAPLPWNHTLLHVPRGTGEEVIVGELQVRRGRLAPEVLPKRLNVVTQRAVSVARGAPANAAAWLFDPAGEPRIVTSISDGRSTVHRRADAEWTPVASFPTLAAAFAPQFIDGDGALYVTVSTGREGYNELRRFDLAAGRVEDTVVVRTPGFDFAGRPVHDPESGRLLGIRIVTDAETTHWLDARMKQVQALADRRFPGRVNRLTCGRCAADDMIVLVHSWSDQDPGQWALYRAGGGTWEPVGRVREDIDPAGMATLDPHRFKARDGRQIPAWVTLPRRPKPAPLAPAVVLVHGGPWLRGANWAWRAEAQFLASRGYVVIEPEFRGSTGYGRAHFEAGWKQWGRAMQDDVADAVHWAVARGWVDPKRVCVAGGSYGGYAALMGLIRHPDLYRCGAAWVTVTDPRLLFSWALTDLPEEARQHDLPKLIGDPVTDAAMLADAAPVEHAARIKAPLLLAFGGNDRRVPLEHGTRMRDALRAAGQEPEYVVYAEEGHGWLKLDNRLDFYRRLERFLGEHLR